MHINISGIGDIDVDVGIKSIATSLSKVYATGMNKIELSLIDKKLINRKTIK